MKVSDIMSGRVVTISQHEPVIAAARLLKRMNLGALPVTDDKGRLKGMLTDRDIVLRCVAAGADPKTLESRLVPGLFACGEVLDIDGDCGGYNLQWAWASGCLAGRLGS